VTDSTTGLDDSVWYDQLQSPSGDVVLMPCSNREQYLRSGLPSDHGNPTGPTAPFPA
jgi:hypothetical protein